MNTRHLAIAIGILAFTLAIAVLGNVLTLGVGSWAIILVGVLTLLVALNTLTRRHGVRDHGTTPDPEHRYRVPAPGAELTDAVDQFRSRRNDLFVPSNRIHAGLREAAIAALTRFQGLTPAAANERVEDGSWTDDPYAAAFLSPSVDPPERSLRERVTDRFVRDVSFRDSVRRTGAAVAAIGYTGLGDGAPDRSESRIATYERDDTEEDEPVPRTTQTPVDGVVERSSRRTGHWFGVGVVALIAISIGTFTESAAVVMAGAVGIAYAGFGHAMEAPTPDISIERTLSEETPEPGDEIGVEVTITNESSRPLPDLRFVDGVPPGLAVSEGTARLGTALRPGESVTLEYTVAARRGRHVFDPALVFTRDLSRSSEKEFLVGSPTSITCEPVLRPITTSVPLRATAATFSGRLTTPEGGSGTQFHSVREYRKNDPLNRIDWNRHARTGELATLEFHEERAARVLVLVDARKANYLAPEPDAAHAVDRSVAAAGRIAATLLEDGDTVGLAAIGPLDKREEDGDDGPVEQCWLGPSSGHHHRAQFQNLLATHPQFSTLAPPKSRRWTPQLEQIYRRLSSDTQIILLTPLCDRVSSDIVQWLDARGYAVTVVSPDPTTDRTTGNQLARVARRIRRFDLQRTGVPVVDWPADQSIDEAFARINAGSGVSSRSGSTAGSTAGTDSRSDAGATTGSGAGTGTEAGGSP
ncbi:DUF58 domain-containing protein [Halobacteria archaeon AArc-m2/3/4]|uniref:DUF58 domain-containing protein n=1 Tax=Natronoglomus mannanivorans TaxID=2979990 RepID=A0ABT2Q9P0_9EURY|nr:DUF58 domain-containing protein [Halobacteria archaeon AArc-m2/3/4]